MKQVNKPELMDIMQLSPQQLNEVIRFLSFVHLKFGGEEILIRHLNVWSQRWDRGATIRFLDVGTGGADVPLTIHRWAQKHQWKVQIIGIDMAEDIAEVALQRTAGYADIEIQKQNVYSLDESQRFDYVLGSLFLHHVNPEAQVGILQLFDRLAQRGVLISDLLRSYASYYAVWTLSRVMGNEIVKNDAPLSVQRAFLPRELRAMAKTAGLPYLKAQKEPWFRLSLAGEKL